MQSRLMRKSFGWLPVLLALGCVWPQRAAAQTTITPGNGQPLLAVNNVTLASTTQAYSNPLNTFGLDGVQVIVTVADITTPSASNPEACAYIPIVTFQGSVAYAGPFVTINSDDHNVFEIVKTGPLLQTYYAYGMSPYFRLSVTAAQINISGHVCTTTIYTQSLALDQKVQAQGSFAAGSLLNPNTFTWPVQIGGFSLYGSISSSLDTVNTLNVSSVGGAAVSPVAPNPYNPLATSTIPAQSPMAVATTGTTVFVSGAGSDVGNCTGGSQPAVSGGYGFELQNVGTSVLVCGTGAVATGAVGTGKYAHVLPVDSVGGATPAGNSAVWSESNLQTCISIVCVAAGSGGQVAVLVK